MSYYPLYFGSFKEPHSMDQFSTEGERFVAMWAMALCDKPDLAWFYNAGVPGIIDNRRMSWESFERLSQEMQAKIIEEITGDNELTSAVC